MKFTTKESFLFHDAPAHEVPCSPWWVGSVFVRSWSAEDRVKFFAYWEQEKDESEITKKVCALSLSDEEGNQLFSDDDCKEYLNNKHPACLLRIANEALIFNGIGAPQKKVDN